MRKAMVLGVLGLAGAVASPAFADDKFRGWRLGATIGNESFQSDVDYVGYFDSVDENRLSYSFFGGWGLNKWLAVEVGFRDGGEFNAHLNSGGAFPTREIEQHTDIRGFEASVIATNARLDPGQDLDSRSIVSTLAATFRSPFFVVTRIRFPAFSALAGDVGLASFPLGIEAIEFLLEAFLR